MKCSHDIMFLWVVIQLVITTHNASAQSYSITPTDSIEGSVPYNDLYHFIIQQNNLTEDILILKWEKIYADIPLGWSAYLCDLGFCYGNFPDSGTMDTVHVGEYGLLSVGVNPFDVNGTGVIQYSVWNATDPEIIDTLTWIIHAENTTTIKNTSLNNYIIYPNPAFNQLTISSSFIGQKKYKIINYNGVIVGIGDLNSSQTQISLNALPEGIYYIVIYDDKTIFSEQLIIQR